MATGLFDTAATVHEDASSPETEEYRALSGTAVAAMAFAVLAPLAFIDWWMLAVPLLGLGLAVVALVDIAKRPTALTGRALAIGAGVVSLLCLTGATAWLSVVYATELPPGHERLGYAQLQPAPGEPATAVPESAVPFHGRDVLIKGYMYPGTKQRGIAQFLLVRDQGDCCFGGNPKITDRVLVQLKDPGHPKGIDFSSRLTKIAGRFAIRPMGAPGMDGGVLYHLEDAFAR